MKKLFIITAAALLTVAPAFAQTRVGPMHKRATCTYKSKRYGQVQKLPCRMLYSSNQPLFVDEYKDWHPFSKAVARHDHRQGWYGKGNCLFRKQGLEQICKDK